MGGGDQGVAKSIVYFVVNIRRPTIQNQTGPGFSLSPWPSTVGS